MPLSGRCGRREAQLRGLVLVLAAAVAVTAVTSTMIALVLKPLEYNERKGCFEARESLLAISWSVADVLGVLLLPLAFVQLTCTVTISWLLKVELIGNTSWSQFLLTGCVGGAAILVAAVAQLWVDLVSVVLIVTMNCLLVVCANFAPIILSDTEARGFLVAVVCSNLADYLIFKIPALTCTDGVSPVLRFAQVTIDLCRVYLCVWSTTLAKDKLVNPSRNVLLQRFAEIPRTHQQTIVTIGPASPYSVATTSVDESAEDDSPRKAVTDVD